MSMDLHVYVERRDPALRADAYGAWSGVEGSWGLNSRRDRDFFDILGGDGHPPLIQHVDDYPDGGSSAFWGPVMTYASLRELVEFDWDREYQPSFCRTRGESASRTYAEIAAELLVMLPKLRELGDLDDVRILFRFDY